MSLEEASSGNGITRLGVSIVFPVLRYGTRGPRAAGFARVSVMVSAPGLLCARRLSSGAAVSVQGGAVVVSGRPCRPLSWPSRRGKKP